MKPRITAPINVPQCIFFRPPLYRPELPASSLSLFRRRYVTQSIVLMCQQTQKRIKMMILIFLLDGYCRESLPSAMRPMRAIGAAREDNFYDPTDVPVAIYSIQNQPNRSGVSVKPVFGCHIGSNYIRLPRSKKHSTSAVISSSFLLPHQLRHLTRVISLLINADDRWSNCAGRVNRMINDTRDRQCHP